MQPNISHVTATEITLNTAHLSRAARPIDAAFSDVMPLVFVIDDEVSVRESLERGWPRASGCRRRLKRLRIVGESALWRGVIKKATLVAAPDGLVRATANS